MFTAVPPRTVTFVFIGIEEEGGVAGRPSKVEHPTVDDGSNTIHIKLLRGT
jgi:hypothetical protein